MKATLLLPDKSRWEGQAFGAPGVAIGHIACHTGEYMDFCADPACANQLVFPAAPLVGMLGLNIEHGESGKPWLSGLILRDVCDVACHWRSAEGLNDFLRRHFITAIAGLDTRALLRHIQKKGPFRAAICANPDFQGWDALLAKLNGSTMGALYPAAARRPTVYRPDIPAVGSVGLIDLGSPAALIKSLLRQGLAVTRLPPLGDWTPEEFPRWAVSHGAREDGHDNGLAAKIKQIIASGRPLLAVGNGFSLICQALGLPMTATRFGFHGDDIAVDGGSRTLMTAQNHRLTLRLPKDAEIEATHSNVVDRSCVGFALPGRPVSAFQFQTPHIFPKGWNNQ